MRAWMRPLLGFVLLLLASLPRPALLLAQVPTELCTAEIQNRTAAALADGGFRIENVPADGRLARVRLTCESDSGTRSGLSRLLVVRANEEADAGELEVTREAPRLTNLRAATFPEQIDKPSGRSRIFVLGTFADGFSADLAPASTGTSYRTSNPAVATVSIDGEVLAGGRSGVAVITVTNGGLVTSTALEVRLSGDTDGDGLPDDFETANPCLDPAVPDGADDPDGDGLTSLEELALGTEPCLADTDGDGLSDRQEGAAGSDPLLPDSDFDGLLDSAEPSPASDFDGDGLPNVRDPDSDNDGLPDGVEFALVGNLTGADPNADNDGDGLSNLDEVELATDPTRADTDFDNLDDGQEVLAGTDPFDPDSDADGFPDGFEVGLGSDPSDASSLPNLDLRFGEAESAVVSILEAVDPSRPDPDGGVGPEAFVGEAVGSPFSLLNAVDPSRPDPDSPVVPEAFVGEVVGTVFSIYGFITLGDLDGDGLPNAWETDHGFDPRNPSDAAEDPDGDGLSNLGEFGVGTDPGLADTDGDGLADGEEVAAGEDPLTPETVPPTVALTGVTDGEVLLEGESLILQAPASDNAQVTEVGFLVDGVSFARDPSAPYTLTFTVPHGVTELVFRATARDVAGNRAATPEIRVSVAPDPLTTVEGSVVDAEGLPAVDAEVHLDLRGLRAELFRLDSTPASFPDLGGRLPEVTRFVSAVNFRNPGGLFGGEILGADLGPDFALRLTGRVEPLRTGKHTFILGATGGARLWLGGNPVVEVPVSGSFTEATADVSLPAGALALVIESFHPSGLAELQLSWVPPGGGSEREVVPPSALAQEPMPFTAPVGADGSFVFPGVPTILGAIEGRATRSRSGEPTGRGVSPRVAPVGGGFTSLGAISLSPCVFAPRRAIAWWPGEGDGAEVIEGQTGMLENGAGFGSGEVGRAFRLDGLDQFVRVPHDPALSVGAGEDFTVEAWLRLETPTDGHDDEILAKVDIQNARTGVTRNGLRFALFRDSHRVLFNFFSDGQTHQMFSATSVPLGEWTHAAVVRAGDEGRIYLDGVPDATATLAAGSLENTDPLTLGGLYDTLFVPPVQRFHAFGGSLDEITFYRRALTAEEIAAIFDAGTGGKCRP